METRIAGHDTLLSLCLGCVIAETLTYYGPYSGLYQAYIELFEYLEKEQWKIVGQPRASYVDGIWNEEDPQKWLTIIQVPVEKA